MKLNVLLIGSGGREHAIAWKLSQSEHLAKLYITPGNSGTAQCGENVVLDVSDNQAVVDFAKEHRVDLVIVAPDDYLAAGMVDALQSAGIHAFGPTKAAAQIEWSKAYAKELMSRARVPTAVFETFTDVEKAKAYLATQQFPLVIKASGLALGKGVVIAPSREEATAVLDDIMVKEIFAEAGREVVIEEFLEGTEISIHAFCDGKTAALFPPSQDHKQIFTGDRGPNTGGMGTIAPVPWVTPELMDTIQKTIVEPILRAMEQNGTPFAGVLYPGLMITNDGPKVIEFNSRFGDPETQSYMRLLKSDLLEICMACATGKLREVDIQWSSAAACCIVVASKGYPATSEKGIPVEGILDAENQKDIVVFHAGAKQQNHAILTNGGRVLGVTATGKTLATSLKKAYAGVAAISFPGMQYRTDIGRRKAFVIK